VFYSPNSCAVCDNYNTQNIDAMTVLALRLSCLFISSNIASSIITLHSPEVFNRFI
jgi:hypothetical protein